jgi:hypothetical protein
VARFLWSARRPRGRVGFLTALAVAPWSLTSVPVMLGLVALAQSVPPAASALTPAEARAKKAPGAETATTQSLNALLEAQRMLAVDLSELRAQLKDVQDSIGNLRDDMQQERAAATGLLDQIKELREEVRGLYVESSGLKGDIAQLGKQVDGLDDSLGNFRLSAGIVVAVIIVLQVVLAGLLLRGRG